MTINGLIFFTSRESWKAFLEQAEQALGTDDCTFFSDEQDNPLVSFAVETKEQFEEMSEIATEHEGRVELLETQSLLLDQEDEEDDEDSEEEELIFEGDDFEIPATESETDGNFYDS